MKLGSKEKWVLLGASSGLGKSFFELTQEHSEIEVLCLSRKTDPSFDFSKEEDWPRIQKTIESFQPTRLFYFAGGGPWGPYPEKKWSSQLWTYRVNLLFPAYLLNSSLMRQLSQAVWVGSGIAESQPDSGAASYASAKHGLKGLITTLQAEKSWPHLDLRLFSPGYLDTPLLPAHAWPRQAGLAQSPRHVALQMWDWIQSEQSRDSHWIL